LPNFAAETIKNNRNMKVITMESSAFTALTEQIAEIAAHVRAVSGEREEKSTDRLLTTREAAHLLNVSTRTLQRMRSEHRIGYVVLRGKCRYRQSEIDRLLADCTVMEDAATPTELKRNHTLRTGSSKPKGRRT
jgi:excisionase family DNA binding protein